MKISARCLTAIEEEAADLIGLVQRLLDQTGAKSLKEVEEELGRRLEKAATAREGEEALEAGAQLLRQRWLDLASAQTHENYRPPPLDQPVHTPTREYVNFGYERELQPTLLEARCRAFFGRTPEGWRADHVLFSSGQAAMTAALHLLEPLFFPRRAALKAVHVGAYFETAELLRLLPSLLQVVASGQQSLDKEWPEPVEVALVEPLFFEETFTRVATTAVAARLSRKANAPLVIFDDTLLALSPNIPEDLGVLSQIEPRAVLRIASGLKLFQAGLELANVGVASVYVRTDKARIADRLREIRALLGLGLTFAEVAALEARWFLDRDYTLAYSQGVFANNETLAGAVDGDAASLQVSHPALENAGADAPFALLRLPGGDNASYERLAQQIQVKAEQMDILFERGGSFGFRGHRYDAIFPRDGRPFLRVAAGRRRGWSLDGVIELLPQL